MEHVNCFVLLPFLGQLQLHLATAASEGVFGTALEIHMHEPPGFDFQAPGQVRGVWVEVGVRCAVKAVFVGCFLGSCLFFL